MPNDPIHQMMMELQQIVADLGIDIDIQSVGMPSMVGPAPDRSNVEVFDMAEALELGFELHIPNNGNTAIGCDDVDGINRFPGSVDPTNRPEDSLAVCTEGFTEYEADGCRLVQQISVSDSRLSSAPELLQLVEDGDSYHLIFPMLAHLSMEGHNDDGCPGDPADMESIECRWVHVCDIKAATVPKSAVQNCMEIPSIRAEVEQMISARLMSEASELHGVPMTFGIGGDC